MSVEIREVTSKKELKKFVKFNIELYKGGLVHQGEIYAGVTEGRHEFLEPFL